MISLEQGITLQLPIVDEAINPFHSVESLRREVRGYDEDDILRLVHLQLIVAFDISNGDHDRRMELRFLPASVDHFKSTNGREPFPFDWESTRKEIFKGLTQRLGDVQFVEAKKAKLVLNCSGSQLMSFVPRQIKTVPNTRWSSGPNGSAKLLVDSLLEFLRKRRVK